MGRAAHADPTFPLDEGRKSKKQASAKWHDTAERYLKKSAANSMIKDLTRTSKIQSKQESAGQERLDKVRQRKSINFSRTSVFKASHVNDIKLS